MILSQMQLIFERATSLGWSIRSSVRGGNSRNTFMIRIRNSPEIGEERTVLEDA